MRLQKTDGDTANHAKGEAAVAGCSGGDRLRVNREGVEHCVTGLCGEYNIKVGVLAMERGI
jgi:hypothetical protein